MVIAWLITLIRWNVTLWRTVLGYFLGWRLNGGRRERRHRSRLRWWGLGDCTSWTRRMLYSQLSPRIDAKRGFKNLGQEGEESRKFVFAQLLMGQATPILMQKPDGRLYVLRFFYLCCSVTNVGFEQQWNSLLRRLSYYLECLNFTYVPWAVWSKRGFSSSQRLSRPRAKQGLNFLGSRRGRHSVMEVERRRPCEFTW
jgi:hypothetical protein